MDVAAKCGNLEMIEWLHSNSREGCTTRAMDEAAKSGNVGFVRWLHEHRTERCSANAPVSVELIVDPHAVEWLVANGLAQEAAMDAIESVQVDVVEWMLPLLPNELNAGRVARIRSLEMAQLLHVDGGFPLGSKDYRCALMSGRW
jgi:hypothetical protein